MRIGLFGLPGAGKGTQAERIAKRFCVPHISTGDMFRELQSGTSKLAQDIRAVLSSGELVSDEMVTELTFERLGRKDCQQGFVLDGYPRTLPQAETLQKSMFALRALICINVERPEIIKRLSGRRVCEQCKRVFSVDFLAENGTKCPHDGSALVQRADDTIEAIATRLAVFEKNFAPVVKFFESRGLLQAVDGNGSADEVFARLIKVIGDVCA